MVHYCISIKIKKKKKSQFPQIKKLVTFEVRIQYSSNLLYLFEKALQLFSMNSRK